MNREIKAEKDKIVCELDALDDKVRDISNELRKIQRKLDNLEK